MYGIGPNTHPHYEVKMDTAESWFSYISE
jgi:hypothetical protein